jgi:N-acyl-D-amino-acid deacylase
MREARGEFKKSFDEIYKIAQTSKAKIIIDDFRPLSGVKKDFDYALGQLEDNPDLYFFTSPYSVSENHIYSYLPKNLRQGNLEKMLVRLKDESNNKTIEAELKKHDLRGLKIVSAPRHHFLVGKSLVDVAHKWDISYIKAMVKLMEMSELRATVAHEDVNENALRNILAKESTLITADSSGVTQGAGFDTNEINRYAFSEYLRIVAREGLLPIEDAVKKITSIPAKVFGIKDRGVLEEGLIADMVLISKDDYRVKEVILGGRVLGEDDLHGSIIKYRRY